MNGACSMQAGEAEPDGGVWLRGFGSAESTRQEATIHYPFGFRSSGQRCCLNLSACAVEGHITKRSYCNEGIKNYLFILVLNMREKVMIVLCIRKFRRLDGMQGVSQGGKREADRLV